MMSHLLPWLIWNGLAGGVLLTVGCCLAAMTTSPVRRLRLLECTLPVVLLAPALLTIDHPWSWSLKWLPVTEAGAAPPAANQDVASETATFAGGVPGEVSRPFPAEQTPIDAEAESPQIHAANGSAIVRPWMTLGTLLVGIQLGAMGLIAARWLVGWVVLGRIWRRAVPAGASVWKVFDTVREPSCSTVVDIRVAGAASTACAFGLRRQCILLPEDLIAEGRAEQLRFALAHEWAHLSRGDLWTWRLTRLAQFCCWFQPAYWWLRRQVRLSQDFLADAAAAEAGPAVEFAAFLVEYARDRSGRLGVATLPLTSRPSDLARRVNMLLDSHHPLERRCPRRVMAAFVTSVTLVLTASAFVRVEARDATTETATVDDDQPATTPAAADDGERLTYKCRVVTRGTQAPVAGATIRVKRSLYGDPRYPKSHGIETTTHTTDNEGYYTVVFPAEQTRERYLYVELDVEHSRHATKQGFGYAMSMIRKNEKLGERPFFELTELAPAEPVTGRLLTPSGTAAANVKIMGYQYPGESPWNNVDGFTGSFFEGTTDADGRFSVPIVTPGRGAFWFQPESAAPQGLVASDARGDVGDVKLIAGVRVAGRVLDAEGNPVAGVSVNAARTSPESPSIDNFNRTSGAAGGYSRSTQTDDSGRFELAPVEEGEYEFRVAEYEKANGTADYPGVFTIQKVEIAESAGPLEFRALPTVSIIVRNMDAAGEPRRGFEFTAWGSTTGKGAGWFATQSTRPADGVCVAEIPRGLENVRLTFMDNEHGSYRVRRSPDAELEAVRAITLGTVDVDVTGIEVVRYKAPVLLVKAVDEAGNTIDDFTVAARSATTPDDAPPAENSERSEVYFEKQGDGRRRSQSLLPELAVLVSVKHPGRQADPQAVSLAEGEVRELVFVMRPKSTGE